ncbi:hypothetical protein J6590_012418 [Homalodisca vitripennis]|nr:hypothetical protein J6590_012418 [Homalodisca vitripennis]
MTQGPGSRGRPGVDGDGPAGRHGIEMAAYQLQLTHFIPHSSAALRAVIKYYSKPYRSRGGFYITTLSSMNSFEFRINYRSYKQR